jgi:hypothetical protein
VTPDPDPDPVPIDPILWVAERVAADEPVDWAEAHRIVNGLHTMLERLREVEAVARAYSRPADVAAPAAAEPAPAETLGGREGGTAARD